MSNDPAATLTNMARQLLTSNSGAVVDRAAVETAVNAVAPIVAATTGHVFDHDQTAAVVRALESLFVVEQCPSSADLGHFVGFREGGSGSLGIEVMRRSVGAASDDLRWSGV